MKTRIAARRAIVVALAAMLIGAIAAAAAPAQQQTSDVYRIADGSVVEGASAQLVRTDEGLSMRLQTSDLEPGAYTVWWTIFNNPDACTDPCSPDDLPMNGGDPDVNAVLPNATGHAAGADGTGNFAADIRVGTEEGLVNPRGADVHLVLRTHGPVIPGSQNAQFNSLNGGCTEDGLPPDFPGDACENIQVAIFPAPVP